jgi:hypothetical protein
LSQVHIDAAAAVEAKRAGIIVLGMHRSGTSMLTRVLNMLGCELPSSIVGAGVGNEAGHWESKAIVELDDELLASAGSRWDDWQPFNPRWEQSVLSSGYRARAEDVLRSEYGAFPLFVLKDPRICRLAGLWLGALASTGVDAGVVVTVRSPSDVASSLEERDEMQNGYAHLLWLRHVLDAESASRGTRRVFCTYDEFFQDWRSVITRIEVGLNLVLPRNTPIVRAEVAKFIQPGQRHFADVGATGHAEDEVFAWANMIYAILARWSRSGEDASDHPTLDGIRGKFNSASLAFSQLILAGSPAVGGAGAGHGRRAALEAKLAEAQATLSQIEQLLGDVTSQRDALGERDREQSSDIAAHKATIEALTLSLDQALESERASHAEVVRLAEVAASAEARAAQADSALRQRQEEIAQTMAALESEQSLREALQRDVQAAREQEVFARQQLTFKQNALDKSATELEANLNDLRQLQKALDASSANYAALLQQNEDITSKYAEAREEAANQRRSAGEASSALAKRYSELATLTNLLKQEEIQADAARKQVTWLCAVNDILTNQPSWWKVLPPEVARRKLLQRLKIRNVFDAELYLERYPDVRASGMDPLRHYTLHGLAEGRRI